MTSPKVTILAGGVEIPLVEQDFNWSLRSGVLPYTTSVIIPSGLLSDFLDSAVNPVALSIEYTSAIGKKNFTRQSILFENLFLHDRRKHSVFEHIFKLSDVRYLLRGKKAFIGKNMTRVVTEVGFLNPPAPTKQGNVSPTALRQPFDVFKLGRYIRSSVKQNGDPFTVSEVIRDFLLSLNLPVPITIDPFILNQDGDYFVENIVIEGEDIYSALSRILRMGRLNIGILPNGELYIFSVDFFDQSGISSIVQISNLVNSQRFTTSPGLIYFQDLKRIRPPKITVLFERMNETRIAEEKLDGFNEFIEFISVESPVRPNIPIQISTNSVIDESSVNSRRSISCINLIKVPFVPSNSLIPIGVGQYFPILPYLELILGIGLQPVLKFWWNIALERLIQRDILQNNNAETDALARIIAQAIRSDFRQLYQIDRFHLDRIKSWDNKRVEVVDNFSGYRPPSPLWKDMTLFPRNRDVSVIRGQVVHQKNALSYKVNDFDPLRQNPTAGTIGMVNQELGIFRVQYPPLSDSLVAEIVPSALEDDVVFSPKVKKGDELLANKPLAKEHVMETIVSVVWSFDPKDKFDSRYSQDVDGKYFDLEFDYQDAEGPEIEFLSSMDYARFNVDGEIVNLGVLQAIAEAEAAKIFNQFKDRNVGFVKLPGIVDNFRIEGNLNNIIYSVSPQGMQTSFDLTQIPFDPEIIQLLPNAARAYLYRMVGKGGP